MKRLADLLPEFSKRRFERLPDEQKLAVGDAYVRHSRACRAHGMEPDPMFLVQVIDDVKRYGVFWDEADAIDFAKEGFGLEIQ